MHWAAVLVLALLALSCANPVQGVVPGDTHEQLEPKTYVLPILRWGPNNQKRDLRHVLSLVKELEVGLILTGIFKHYRDLPPPSVPGPPAPPAAAAPRHNHILTRASQFFCNRLGGSYTQQDTVNADDSSVRFQGRPEVSAGGRPSTTSLGSCFAEPVQHYMPFEQVMDRSVVHEWVPTATVAELKAAGWDGRLDATVHPDNYQQMSWTTTSYVVRTLEAEGVSVSDTAEHIAVESPMHCDPQRIKELKKRLSQYRFVGLQVVLLGYTDMYDLQQEALGPNKTVSEKAKCHRTLHKANVLLRPAPWLRQLARRYMEEVAGFKDDKYLAVHVRPYPDACLDVWRWGKFAPVNVTTACTPEHVDLHMRLGTCTAVAQAQAEVDKVFVMCHPAIRVPTNTMLALAGLSNAVYLETKRLLELANCTDTSSTFLSIIEEAIAVESTVFVGTSISTATHTIAYERIGMHRLQNNYWEDMKC